MQPEHASVVASLAELRAIEQQRIADEQSARVRAEQARLGAIAEAERARQDAIAAAERAAYEGQLAIERARVAAEREARVRVETAEAAERARQLMILAHARTAGELEIRRTVAARTRPTWMIAVTGIAMAAAGVLVWFALESRSASAAANTAAEQASAEKAQALAEADAARLEMDRLAADMHRLDAEVATAVQQVAEADNAFKAKAARTALAQKQEALRQAAIATAKAKAWRDHQERIKGHTVSDACLKNAVCK